MHHTQLSNVFNIYRTHHISLLLTVRQRIDTRHLIWMNMQLKNNFCIWFSHFMFSHRQLHSITLLLDIDEGMSDYFVENGYKYILALGLLVNESAAVKTVCADKGCILTVLDCLRQRKHSISLCKWSLWALMVRTCCGVYVCACQPRHHNDQKSVFEFWTLTIFFVSSYRNQFYYTVWHEMTWHDMRLIIKR